jgi:hypothetical protein
VDTFTFQVNFNLTVVSDGEEAEAREKAFFVLRKFIISPESFKMRRFMKLIKRVAPEIKGAHADPVLDEAAEIDRLDNLVSGDDFNPDIMAGYL